MADAKDLIEILTRGGPAEGVQAALGGFQQGRKTAQDAGALDLETRKAAFQKKLQEAGLFSAEELGSLPSRAGLNLTPGRLVPADTLEKMVSLTSAKEAKDAAAQSKKDQMAPLSADDIEANAQAIELSGAPNAKELARVFRTSAPKLSSDKGSNLAARLMGIATPAATTSAAPERAQAAEAKRVFNEKQRSLRTVRNSMEKLKGAAQSLGDFKTGVFSQLMAKGKMSVEEAAADPAVAKYNQVISQEISNLTRNLGQTGVLTDQDIILAREAIGNRTAPLHQKMSALQGILANAYANAAAAAEAAGDFTTAEEYDRQAEKARTALFAPEGGQQAQEVPKVGGTFNGAKVLKVTRIQ